MANRFYRQHQDHGAPDGDRDAPEADLVEEPGDQRAGHEPEDLPRSSDEEQASRARELRDDR